MKVCLLVIGDGRDEIHERAWDSVQKHVVFDHKVLIDDREHSLGFAGAVAEGWRKARATNSDWIFHFEADFIFNSVVPLDRMVSVLMRKPYLAQLSLKRQPWNEREKAGGGIVEADAEDFTQVTDAGDVWTEHRRYWTTNPSLYPASWCAQPWPQEPESEGKFTHRLLADPKVRFGIWGAKFDPPMVEHIGVKRTGHGY
jgi:hypothetical protein